jgi:hypothetical protein
MAVETSWGAEVSEFKARDIYQCLGLMSKTTNFAVI